MVLNKLRDCQLQKSGNMCGQTGTKIFLVMTLDSRAHF